MDDRETIRQQAHRILDEWIASCTRGNKVSRNTVAIGIVVFDHLRAACPVSKDDVVSSGGEVKGARSGLRKTLAAYGISSTYLKEATTRQAHQDGQALLERLQWGNLFLPLPAKDRDFLLLELIDVLTGHARAWLARQNLILDVDRGASPATWVHAIVESARAHSGGVVEQHLVGAKLQRRFPETVIPNHPAHAADQQTARSGDFVLSSLVYHVTASPTPDVVGKCASNIRSGQHPILLVPRDKMPRAVILAEDEHIENDLTIISIEDFVALNVIELAADQGKSLFEVMNEIVAQYNDRLAQAETDQSLRIKLR